MRNVSLTTHHVSPEAARRGDATKAILITLAVVGVIMILSCAGAGIAMYVFVHRTLGKLAVTDPVQIRKMTTDIVDIVVPAQFVPQNGSSFMGLTSVTYTWCPTGNNCPPVSDSHLTITTFGQNEPPTSAEESKSEVDEMIKGQFREFTREDREFDIRGQKISFTFVLGEEGPFSGDEDEESNMPSASEKQQTDQPAAADQQTTTVDPANPAEPTETPETDKQEPVKPSEAAKPEVPGRKIWWIYGKVPGKTGPCTINIQLTPELYDDQTIMNMLKSIH